jgi:cytoskeletal protein CcmA (bactofilin family)
MSVFRSNSRPNDSDANRTAEPAARAESDLLSANVNPEAARESMRTTAGASFPPFAEREVRAMPVEAEKCANVIAAGSKWSGTLNIEDSVRIEGQLSGEVNAKGTVHISEGARVEAKIRASFVIVSGAFKGEVRCSERLELLPKSRLEGQIVTKVLNVHEGAVLDGSIQMTAEREPATTARTRETPERNGSDAAPEPTTRSRATTA